MSFATHLEIQIVEGEFTVESVASDLRQVLNEDGIHEDVLTQLKQALGGKETMFNLSASYVSYLIERVARLQPSVAFHARGRGEELRDVWVREFQDGEATFSVGSFL